LQTANKKESEKLISDSFLCFETGPSQIHGVEGTLIRLPNSGPDFPLQRLDRKNSSRIFSWHSGQSSEVIDIPAFLTQRPHPP